MCSINMNTIKLARQKYFSPELLQNTIPTVKHGGGSIALSITLGLLASHRALKVNFLHIESWFCLMCSIFNNGLNETAEGSYDLKYYITRTLPHFIIIRYLM